MGSLLDEEGMSLFASLCLTDGLENPKREKVRVKVRLIDKPAPTEKVRTKHEHICPLASRILEKRVSIFEYDIFLKSVFVIFYEIVFKRKYVPYKVER